LPNHAIKSSSSLLILSSTERSSKRVSVEGQSTKKQRERERERERERREIGKIVKN
jgi:hypothetical protein